MEWVTIAVVVLLLAMIGAVIVVVFQGKYDQNSEPDVRWNVIMWNTDQEFTVCIRFQSQLILGRANLYNYVQGLQSIVPDTTISREQCAFYEYYGQLYVCNQSTVNPSTINGIRITQPTLIKVGDRLGMGKSIFLISNIEYV